MRTFSCSWTVRKTQARRSREPGICSTPCGFLTSLWSGSRRTRTGPWWTLMSAQGYMIAGGRSLRPCIKSRSHKSLFAIFNPVWLLYALYLIICWVSYYMYFFCQRIFYDIKTEMFLNYKQNYNKRLNNWSCVKKKKNAQTLKMLVFWSDMNKKAKEGRRSRPSSCGMPSLRRRRRRGRRTCCTRTTVTGSPTSRTWAPSSVATCVQRL